MQRGQTVSMPVNRQAGIQKVSEGKLAHTDYIWRYIAKTGRQAARGNRFLSASKQAVK